MRQATANLRTALDAVGARPDQVTKITAYVGNYEQSLLTVMAKHVRQAFVDAVAVLD